MRKCIALAVLALAAPLAAKEAPIDYGAFGSEPEDPIGATKRLMLDELRDPDSAQYRFLGIHPAHCRGGLANGGKDWIGYAASIDINAKNTMGGYVGFTSHTILFDGGRAFKSIEGDNFGAYGPAKGLLGLGGGAGVCRWLDH